MNRKNDGLRLMDGAGYKKIIIACDSYKGCLSSREVNEAIASGVKEWNAEDASSGIENVDSEDASPEIICLEMSDGGEGMLDAFLSAMKGERVSIHAHDALMRWIEAEYGIVNDTAIIEIAQTAGLALIEPEQRNPMKATSWGVGEMIMNAYRRGVRHFIVGLGGSATSDCGIGMLKAMGDDWKKIRQECSFVLASDVTNPLCGENGAAHVFAPQKGADAEMVEMLDARARKFAEVSAKHFGYDRSEVPGAGAAGGLGYAFLQYFGAEVSAGAELLLREIGFDEMIRDADLVITGEGHSDRQTLMGKLPQRILEHVLKNKATTDQQIWLVSGGISEKQALLDAGFDQVLAVSPQNMDLEEAMNPEIAKRNIANAIKVSFGNT
jgi:glycerate kinase